MRDLSDECFFEYKRYEDFVEDIITVGHMMFIYDDKLYFVNPGEGRSLCLLDDRGGNLIMTFKDDDEFLNSRFLNGQTVKEAFKDIKFMDW